VSPHGVASTLDRVFNGALTSGKIKVLAGHLFVYVDNIIAGRLEVGCRVVRFCHENIISWKALFWGKDVLCVDELFVYCAQVLEGGLELCLRIGCLGGGGDESEPLALCADIVRRRHAANVNVYLSF